ncbi:YciE/YciF family protein [Edaphobacter acidisoli]|uniref:YciE/YciF family protein n=1 Tax=Edaphobacter acidisoli TaxID=2040573 RepID=A0A916WAN4_9BACT|nr:ferritin-like domain-containing protein [Edaphobacter acidisoli]GGA80583.1 YciE/YciF family protein [Edaphobacter acidisoli]
MSVQTIDDLMVDELRDLYSAEKQITKALPKMAKAASSDDLRQAFESHLEETHSHVARLETIFESLGKDTKGKTCDGMKGILSEGSDLIGEIDKGEVLDAGLIAAAQRVEHYEMAGYGSVRAIAELLGRAQVVDLLQATLDEEKAADKKLTQISIAVNTQAQRAA